MLGEVLTVLIAITISTALSLLLCDLLLQSLLSLHASLKLVIHFQRLSDEADDASAIVYHTLNERGWGEEFGRFLLRFLCSRFDVDEEHVACGGRSDGGLTGLHPLVIYLHLTRATLALPAFIVDLNSSLDCNGTQLLSFPRLDDLVGWLELHHDLITDLIPQKNARSSYLSSDNQYERQENRKISLTKADRRRKALRPCTQNPKRITKIKAISRAISRPKLSNRMRSECNESCLAVIRCLCRGFGAINAIRILAIQC